MKGQIPTERPQKRIAGRKSSVLSSFKRKLSLRVSPTSEEKTAKTDTGCRVANKMQNMASDRVEEIDGVEDMETEVSPERE